MSPVGEIHRDPICAVDGCDRPKKARNLCNAHYQQQRKALKGDADSRLARFYRESRERNKIACEAAIERIKRGD